MDDMDLHEAPEKEPARRTMLEIPKKAARALAIGDTVTVTVKGEVSMLSGGDDYYSVEVKYKGFPKVEGNAADGALRDLLGERHKNDADKSVDDIFMSKRSSF